MTREKRSPELWITWPPSNAPVATPIDWSELKRDVRFDFFNTRNVPARLAKQKRDPWAEFESTRQSITRAMLKSVGL